MAFLQNCFEQTHSLPVVYARLSAVSYFYRLRGLASPSVGPTFQMYMKGLKRRQIENSAQVRRAKPLTKTLLHRLNEYLGARDPSLREWRTIWRVNLAFYGLLRWDDVSRLKVLYALYPMLSRTLSSFSDCL